MITKQLLAVSSDPLWFSHKHPNFVKTHVYHGTSENHLSEIKKHGLKPSTTTNWQDIPETHKWAKGKVFFSRNEKPARFYAEQTALRHKSNQVIMRVSLQHISKPQHDYKDFGLDSIYTKTTIHPKHIEVKHGHKWVPLHKYKP